MEELAPPGARVLDIAAAQGNFSLALAEAGYVVTWNDLRADLVGYVQSKWTSGEVSYAPGNAFELKLERNFDVVLITEVIEHVAHPDEFLANAMSLIRPGGHVVMTTPNGEYIRNSLPRFTDCLDPTVYEAEQFSPDADGHIFLLHRDEIFEIARRANAQVSSMRYFNNPLTNGHLKLRWLLPVVPRALVAFIDRLTAGAGERRSTRRLNSHVAAVFTQQSETS